MSNSEINAKTLSMNIKFTNHNRICRFICGKYLGKYWGGSKRSGVFGKAIDFRFKCFSDKFIAIKLIANKHNGNAYKMKGMAFLVNKT